MGPHDDDAEDGVAVMPADRVPLARTAALAAVLSLTAARSVSEAIWAIWGSRSRPDGDLAAASGQPGADAPLRGVLVIVGWAKIGPTLQF